MSGIVPLPLPTTDEERQRYYAEMDLTTHSLTGWPKRGSCPNNDDHEAVMLVATTASASYECRGTPDLRGERSAYSPDACPGTFRVERDG